MTQQRSQDGYPETLGCLLWLVLVGIVAGPISAHRPSLLWLLLPAYPAGLALAHIIARSELRKAIRADSRRAIAALRRRLTPDPLARPLLFQNGRRVRLDPVERQLTRLLGKDKIPPIPRRGALADDAAAIVATALERAAGIRYYRSQTKAAVASCQKLLAAAPERSAVYQVLALIADEQGDTATAQKLLKAACDRLSTSRSAAYIHHWYAWAHDAPNSPPLEIQIFAVGMGLWYDAIVEALQRLALAVQSPAPADQSWRQSVAATIDYLSRCHTARHRGRPPTAMLLVLRAASRVLWRWHAARDHLVSSLDEPATHELIRELAAATLDAVDDVGRMFQSALETYRTLGPTLQPDDALAPGHSNGPQACAGPRSAARANLGAHDGAINQERLPLPFARSRRPWARVPVGSRRSR